MSKKKKIKPSYYSITPAIVRYDKDLSYFEIVLYGEITVLSNKKGYCHASNRYLADLFECDPKTISRAVNTLSKKEYIYVQTVYHGKSKQIKERRLYIETSGIIGIHNVLRGMDKKVHRGMDRNVHTNINITSKKISKEQPKGSPLCASVLESPIRSEHFDLFWNKFPYQLGSIGNCRKEWEKVCKLPSTTRNGGVCRPLVSTILTAIKKQKKSERWQEPKFKIYPSKWIKETRWLDDPKQLTIPKSFNDKKESTVRYDDGYVPTKKSRKV